MLSLMLAVLCGTDVVAPSAVDYAKLDRSIKKEPFYRWSKPKYSLLQFGPEAKVRVWAVLVGETLYLDLNGNGDLTEPKEKFNRFQDCKNVSIADPDGKTTYVIQSVTHYENPKPAHHGLMVDVKIAGPVSYAQYSDSRMTDSPKTAGVAHFHGPLTIAHQTIYWKIPESVALHVGDKPAELRVVIGTMDESAGCWVAVRTHHGDKSAFPEGVRPAVVVEYPPATPGKVTVKRKYILDKFC